MVSPAEWPGPSTLGPGLGTQQHRAGVLLAPGEAALPAVLRSDPCPGTLKRPQSQRAGQGGAGGRNTGTFPARPCVTCQSLVTLTLPGPVH